MDIKIIPAYHHSQEIRELFSEYTEMLISGDPAFKEYLEIQNYDAELEHLEDKYGMPAGRLYLAYCDGKTAGCIGCLPDAFIWHTATEKRRAVSV